MTQTVTFNGNSFARFTVIEISRTMPGMRNELATVPGRRGDVFLGATHSPARAKVRFAFDGNHVQRREAARSLASSLLVTEPKKLQFSDDGSLYYMAIVDGTPDLRDFANTGMLDVEFLIPDPAAYGREVTASVASGGSTTITVGGTVAARPRINGTFTRDSSSLIWRLRLDNADYVAIDTGSASSRSVVIDCESRTATVASAVAMITTDSDWLELSPGSHVLRNDRGSGTATVKWTERWL